MIPRRDNQDSIPASGLLSFTGPIRQRYGLLLGLLILGLFKLWVVQTEEIYGSSTEYDALWYVGSAQHWYWGRPYSWTAFVRPCAYPLFIAVVHFCGIPLRIGIELMQMAGYGVLIAALRRGGVPRPLCLIIFALMILHPASFLYNNHTMSDSFYTAILPLTLAGSLLTLFTGRFFHAAWTGVAFAVLWNTREESFLIPVILAVIFLLTLWRRRDAPTRKEHFLFWLKRTGAMAGALCLVVAAVYSANYRVFNSFAKSDLSSPAFERAFKALLRIKPSQVRHYVAVSNEVVQKAYAISPTFARLKPQLEGDLGRNWRIPATAALGVPEYGWWFIWAFRNATADTDALHASPQSANRFYRNVAREINRACDEGRLPCRFVPVSFLDPEAFAYLGYLPESLLRTTALFIRPHHKIIEREDATLTAPQRALYDEMAGRRPNYAEAPAPANFSAALSITLENFIGATYRYLVIALALAGTLAALVMTWFFRRVRLADSLNTALVLIGATILIRVIFFAFFDAICWTDDYERYLFPVMPLTSCFLILLIYQAITIGRGRTSRPAVL